MSLAAILTEVDALQSRLSDLDIAAIETPYVVALIDIHPQKVRPALLAKESCNSLLIMSQFDARLTDDYLSGGVTAARLLKTPITQHIANVRPGLLRYRIKVFVSTAAAQTSSALADEFTREQPLFEFNLGMSRADVKIKVAGKLAMKFEYVLQSSDTLSSQLHFEPNSSAQNARTFSCVPPTIRRYSPSSHPSAPR